MGDEGELPLIHKVFSLGGVHRPGRCLHHIDKNVFRGPETLRLYNAGNISSPGVLTCTQEETQGHNQNNMQMSFHYFYSSRYQALVAIVMSSTCHFFALARGLGTGR